jgi:hypothetical protein
MGMGIWKANGKNLILSRPTKQHVHNGLAECAVIRGLKVLSPSRKERKEFINPCQTGFTGCNRIRDKEHLAADRKGQRGLKVRGASRHGMT